MHILTLPEMQLAGLVFAGHFSILGVEMPKLWSAFLGRENELAAGGGVRYGIHMQEHDGVMIECIGAPLADLNGLPQGMVGLRVPARRYAQFTHQGPMTGVQATYIAAFEALEQAGLQQDSAAWRLERYDSRFTPTVDDHARAANAYDILIPLRN